MSAQFFFGRVKGRIIASLPAVFHGEGSSAPPGGMETPVRRLWSDSASATARTAAVSASPDSCTGGGVDAGVGLRP